MTISVPELGAIGATSPQQTSLFDWVLNQAQQEQKVDRPDQVADALANKLDGYLERSQAFSAPATQASDPTPPVTPSEATGGAEKSNTGMQQSLNTLRKTFDLSIETQMIVRCSTQTSTAVNTLVKG
ncbi:MULTISPECIES: hypothetical protein [Klebsiella/Raoultella group]|uniref:hypothetical protein n=1 Tax=Klebsiella/Raoultella group TaxID=2890311 RepID=UPI00100A1111|nr:MULTISPECIES: hypothetical protein [Klebsiella/Raoultella group]QAV82115.1 hypothetical protein ES964_26950 [Klebsiella pneumoniae]WFW01849.1 hypothetical protein NFJ54_26260 [Klebsiella aerogenes]WSI11169.1 hypothetical protein VTY38_28115 [Klebsiella pneumoniae]